MPELCNWCGTEVPEDDGFRVAEPEERRKAVFCRLEHVVPWLLRGPEWHTGTIVPNGDPDDALGRCAQCGDALGTDRVLVVRHRGQHRIGDAFCRLEHLEAWAKGGGRYKAAS
jgi:hypothetical protein